MTTLTLVFVLPFLAIRVWQRHLGSLPPLQSIAVAAAFSFALPSTVFFLWRLAGGGPHAFSLVDPVLWSGLAALGFYLRKGPGTASDSSTGAREMAAIAAGVTLMGLLYLPLATEWVAASPHGAWDAWAIWNLRAGFLTVASESWRNAFDAALAWSHPDYPLLLPSAVARAWVLGGEITNLLPIAIATAFTVCTVLSVAAALLASHGLAASLVGAVLVAVPAFVQQGLAQLADVPVACFTVLGVTLLAGGTPSAARLALAGAAMGCAAWTKNEGLVVASVLPTAYVLIRLRRRGVAVAWHAAMDLIVGLGPVLVVLALFKIHLAGDNDLVDGVMRPGAMVYWSDPVRVSFVAEYMATEALRWGGWAVGSPVWLLVLLALIPRQGHARHDDAVTAAGVLLVAQLGVFFVIYVMTPHSVAWHLQTSWLRLIAQMWPTAVWWVCSRRTIPTRMFASAAHEAAAR